MTALLEVRGLKAGYGPTHVLHGLDFQVDEGGVTALLGANGAGKTTLLKIVAGLLTPTNGIVLVDNQPVGEGTKSLISYLPERTYLPDWVNGRGLPRLFRGLLCGL